MVEPSLFPIEQRSVSDRPTLEAPRQTQSFSTFLESIAPKRAAVPQEHSRSSPSEQRQIRERDVSGHPRRPVSGASPKSSSTVSRRSESLDEAHRHPATSSRPDHLSAEPVENRRQATHRPDDPAEIEQGQVAEPDQRTEEHDTNGDQSVDVMIALSVSLADPGALNGEPEPSSDGPGAIVITIESAKASAQVIVGLTADEPASSLMEPDAEQSLLAPAEVQDGSKRSGEPRQALPALTDAHLSQTGGQGGSATTTGMPETQAPTDPATMAPGMSPHGEARSKGEPSPLSYEASFLPSDAPLNRTAENPIETWQQGDHPATDGTVEQRPSPEWSPFNGGQDEAMGQQREDQAADSRTEPSQAGRHPAPREGFGETMATAAADRTASPQGGAHRADVVTGRGAISRPHGDEGRPIVQTVSLNLEPADLGPINVRIFMSDRTVHAHIRTDQMDLGQGMLNQQHQLESRLQSSGLEMGEFKVTVDQQQQRGDSQGWLGQQGDRHGSMVDAVQRAAEAEMREPLPVERRRHTGIVSFFA
jgi:hypothetical protein